MILVFSTGELFQLSFGETPIKIGQLVPKIQRIG